MPKATWEQLNSIIHKIKWNLEKVVEVERLCTALKNELKQELEELEKMVLQELEGDNE